MPPAGQWHQLAGKDFAETGGSERFDALMKKSKQDKRPVMGYISQCETGDLPSTTRSPYTGNEYGKVNFYLKSTEQSEFSGDVEEEEDGAVDGDKLTYFFFPDHLGY